MNNFTKIHFFDDDIGGTFKIINSVERKQKVLDLADKAAKSKPRRNTYTGLTNAHKGDYLIKEQVAYAVTMAKQTKRLVMFEQSKKNDTRQKFIYFVLKGMGFFAWRFAAMPIHEQITNMLKFAVAEGYEIITVPVTDYVPSSYKQELKRPLVKSVKPYTVHIPVKTLKPAFNR